MSPRGASWAFVLMLAIAPAILLPQNPRSAPQKAPPANESLAQGIAAYRTGHFAEAQRAFEAAVKANPRLAAAHAYLGLTFARMGKQNAALRELERAHELDPHNPGYAYDTAILLVQTKQYAPAIGILEKLSQQKPPPRDVLVNLARAEAAAGETSKLLVLVSTLPASGYRDVSFLEALAGTLAGAKQDAALEQLWKSAIRRAPDQPLPYAALAEMLAGRGNAAQALALLETAPAAARNPVYWYAYGQTQLALQQNAQAAKTFQRLTRLIPRNERAWSALIHAQALAGNLSQAASAADDALKVLPESAELRYQAALVSYLLGRNGAALTALQPLLARGAGGDDPRPLLLAAVVESASGRYPQAAGHFKKALALPGPCDALAAYFYGAMLLRTHQPADAAVHLRAATKCRQHFALAEYRLGQALVDLQRFKEGEAQFNDAIRDQPDLAEPYYALAQLRRRLGDAKGAEAALQKFNGVHQHAGAADRELLEGAAETRRAARQERVSPTHVQAVSRR